MRPVWTGGIITNMANHSSSTNDFNTDDLAELANELAAVEASAEENAGKDRPKRPPADESDSDRRHDETADDDQETADGDLNEVSDSDEELDEADESVGESEDDELGDLAGESAISDNELEEAFAADNEAVDESEDDEPDEEADNDPEEALESAEDDEELSDDEDASDVETEAEDQAHETSDNADDDLRAPSGWLRVNDGSESLVKSYPFDDFAEALAFANKVGEVAEKLKHHPDITISWGKARIATTTHDSGGLTSKDYELAEAIEELI